MTLPRNFYPKTELKMKNSQKCWSNVLPGGEHHGKTAKVAARQRQQHPTHSVDHVVIVRHPSPNDAFTAQWNVVAKEEEGNKEHPDGHRNPHVLWTRLQWQINQSINQPINQSINQPINQPTNQPINQSINRPINQSINRPINQSIGHYVHTMDPGMKFQKIVKAIGLYQISKNGTCTQAKGIKLPRKAKKAKLKMVATGIKYLGSAMKLDSDCWTEHMTPGNTVSVTKNVKNTFQHWSRICKPNEKFLPSKEKQPPPPPPVKSDQIRPRRRTNLTENEPQLRETLAVSSTGHLGGLFGRSGSHVETIKALGTKKEANKLNSQKHFLLSHGNTDENKKTAYRFRQKEIRSESHHEDGQRAREVQYARLVHLARIHYNKNAQYTNPSIDWLIDWLVDCSIDWLIDWLVDYSIDWLIDWLVDYSIDWLIDWLVDWLTDWLTRGLIDWLITPFLTSLKFGRLYFWHEHSLSNWHVSEVRLMYRIPGRLDLPASDMMPINATMVPQRFCQKKPPTKWPIKHAKNFKENTSG